MFPYIKLGLIAILFSPLPGCAGTFSLEGARANGFGPRQPVATAARTTKSSTPIDLGSCASIDSKYQWATEIGIASGILAGSGGLATIPTTDTGWKAAEAGTAAGLAVVAAVSAAVATQEATSWAARCASAQ